MVRTFKNIPYIVVEMPGAQLENIAKNETVTDYFEDKKVFALEQQLPWGIDRIDAELVHSKFGIKGYGIKVAIIDTGIDLNHPDERCGSSHRVVH